MTLARALDSVAAALHHPIFDPLELKRLRGIVEAASAVVDSVEDEREACAKAICEGCDRGLPVEDCNGDLLHVLPPEEHRPTAYGPGNRIGCDAAAIRARTATTPPADAGKETTT